MKKMFLPLVIIFTISTLSCKNAIKTVENNKDIARKFIEFWSAHDSVKVASLYDEKFEYVDKGFIVKLSSKKDLISFVNGTAQGIPDFIFEPSKVVADENMAMIEWTWKGTFTVGFLPDYPGTNKPFTIQGVTVFEIKNGLITRSTDYYDKETFLKEVGLK